MPPPGLDRANTPGDDLHRVVARGQAALRDRLDAHDRHLPGFVSREVRAFVRCGDPAHGFAWLRCPEGHHHRLVPFSCKGRGFCPSCGGRRMATLAHRWTDELLPRVAVRQLVLTVPWPRRWLLARRPALACAVLRCAMRVVTRGLRSCGGTAARAGAPGSVTVIQRFGSALNLNLHFHVLLLDGLFVPGPGGLPRFQRARPWTQADVDRLVETIATRCEALLARHGHGPDGEPGSGELRENGRRPAPHPVGGGGRTVCRPGAARGAAGAGARRTTAPPPSPLRDGGGLQPACWGGHPGARPRWPEETRRVHRATSPREVPPGRAPGRQGPARAEAGVVGRHHGPCAHGRGACGTAGRARTATAGQPGPVRRRAGLPPSLAPGSPAPPAKATPPTTRRGPAPHQGAARTVAPHPMEHTAVADLRRHRRGMPHLWPGDGAPSRGAWARHGKGPRWTRARRAGAACASRSGRRSLKRSGGA